METKEIKINVPEGYIIDKENSTFECIKFKKKSLTYDDVIKELFCDKIYSFINVRGEILTGRSGSECYKDPNNATSTKQLEKLLAINKLMNVAKYLNGDWKPDWKDDTFKYRLYIGKDDDIGICNHKYIHNAVAYFRTEELVKEAIKILGEDTIRLALSTDW